MSAKHGALHLLVRPRSRQQVRRRGHHRCGAGRQGPGHPGELLPEHPRAPEHLRAAGEGIRSGLNSALEAAAPGGRLPFRCAASMVDGATVISQLVGRLSVEHARERLGRWAAGEASFMIRKPLELVGATAWEAHYNGVPVLRVPV